MKPKVFVIKVVIVILSIVIVVDCMAESPWQASYTLEAKGKYDKAAAIVEGLVDSSPSELIESQIDSQVDREFALLRYGWLLYLGGNYTDSIQAYQRSLKLNTRSIDARLGVMLPLIALGYWDKVKLIANQILAGAPKNYLAHVRLMIAEEGLKQWKVLSIHSAKVSTYYPSDVYILQYYARAEAHLGHTKKALQIYYQILQRSPFHIEANRFVSNMKMKVLR